VSALPGCEWREVPLRDCQLIEASAGTGKTYTIVLLVLRALLETDTRIEQIVVTTYTRAAAQQLKTRLRAQLDETVRVLDAQDPDTSPFGEYLAGRIAALGASEARRRVRAALLSLELACIDTLHAVCARILRDEPLAAPMTCDGEALDAHALGRECLEDAWRARVLSASPGDTPDCSVLLDCGFENVARALAPLLERGTIEFVGVDHAVEQLRCAHFASLREPPTLHALREVLEDSRLEFRLNKEFTTALHSLLEALVGDAKHFVPAEALHEDFAAAAQNKRLHRRRIGEVPAITAVWQLAAFEPGAARARTAAAVEALVSHCRVEMRRRARARDGYTFADLIDAVATALAGRDGDVLAARLRARWPIALIDEFQDTDALQYAICTRIWSHADATLLLIGDPKQAIYGFRGADLYAYLAAAVALAGEPHRLGVNQRSSASLVDAVNAFYVDAGVDPFTLSTLRFEAVLASGRADATPLVSAEGRPYVPLRLHLAPEQVWTRGALDRWCLERCADDIAVSLTPGGPALGGERLDPGHFAVLLPTHRHVAELRALLRARGVPCVGGGRSSVYQSAAAEVLITLLRALLAPGEAAQWRAVLATGLFGANLSDFDGWRIDPSAWSSEVDRQQHLARSWQEHGIGGLLAPLLASRSAAILAVEDGERLLTDLRHLLELLAQVEAAHEGPHALLTRLERMRRDDTATAASDECSLRIEGDSNRVKLLTLHASKGLEFDIVYLPLAWRLGLADGRRFNPAVLALHDDAGRPICDAGSASFDRNETTALAEAHAEQLRLLYVALTRARHACHVFWGSIALRAGVQAGALDAHLARLARRFDTAAGVPAWHAFANAHPHAVMIAPACAVGERWRPRNLDVPATLEVCRERPARTRRWAVHSFTRIVRDSGHRFDPANAAPAEDETLIETEAADSGPVDVALRGGATFSGDQGSGVFASGTEAPLQRWRAWHGTAFGNALHQALERLDWHMPVDSQEVALRTALRDHGIGAPALPALHALAERTLATPLLDGVALRDLAVEDRVAELRFDFALHGAQLSRWPTLFAAHGCPELLPDLPPLAPLDGLLTGAADLVFRHHGRYYLADYKSNDLGDAADAYRGAGLLAAMQRGHYGLQLTLYQLALHRHLRQRLRDYDYTRDCGGALYLFVRGLAGDDGVFRARLPRELIDALDADCAGAVLA